MSKAMWVFACPSFTNQSLNHCWQRFDQGPSLLLLPELFRETFADLGTSLEKEDIHLLRCDPNYEVHFDDGEKITLSSDLCVMKDQIERWEGKDGFERQVTMDLFLLFISPSFHLPTRYLGFLQEAHRHYEVSVEHVLHKNFYSLFHLARPSFLRYIITLHPFESIVRIFVHLYAPGN
jgi:phytoene desaturase (3,4-didehydrolycopene-forming)